MCVYPFPTRLAKGSRAHLRVEEETQSVTCDKARPLTTTIRLAATNVVLLATIYFLEEMSSSNNNIITIINYY